MRRRLPLAEKVQLASPHRIFVPASSLLTSLAGAATPVEGDAVFNPAAIREFTPSFDANASAVS